MIQKKWSDPLEKLLQADKKLSSINEYIDKKKNYTKYPDKILSLDPEKIKRWDGKDRPENEIGDISELIRSIQLIGQQVPCIVRPIENAQYDYELIGGECRWRAAKSAKITLKAIVHNLNDRMASLVQAVENEQRKDLSDYAKGMSYAKKINDGILTQKDLTDVLSISKQQVSRLLSFSKLPPKLIEKIGDFRKVSARTAYELSRLGNKNEENLKIILGFSEKIKTGEMGSTTISRLVENKKVKKNNDTKKIYSKKNKHLFTWRNDEKNKSIHFTKQVNNLKDDVIDNITESILKYIDKQ